VAPCEGLVTGRGLRFFGNDHASYRHALDSFVAMYGQGLPGGLPAGSSADPQGLARALREVHSLAGASAAIGAVSLQAQAARLDLATHRPAGTDPRPFESRQPGQPHQLQQQRQLHHLHTDLIEFTARLRAALNPLPAA
jgi:HPt (histidine-containing phosphotransfer) domain-containing protein